MLEDVEVGPKCTVTLASADASSLETAPQELQTDETIASIRILRNQVHIQQLVSRGSFGEVYSGFFNGQHVAVKLLLPETHANIQEVNKFLMEVKVSATIDHPRIVMSIGVAWSSLSDLCVVNEYMEGGDLRTLLDNYKATNHPVGFQREKATIAMHVCHALAYMHSLSPPVLHGDLKSRKVLLNREMEAKVTGFGSSTSDVGSSLWMAPEVIRGGQYDAKADVFSFGVILSELDLHTLPYAQARELIRDSYGRRMQDSAILQKVAMGSLRVNFSETGPQAMMELGRACVSVNPRKRPTASEALYQLQTILARELA
ncbi:hypothetical protein BBJ28_00024094 [Nothophytophthora sp. Chile5]|nr:hypothetical protein BBJ28_00024094 [Nothophytophthora sp. Chile5]